ncbi:cytochrome c oxidase subunit 6B-like [Phalaenopsis equestris]|uniref:cytochrome c oxidase subunit 6B-like n=1 Tax=Phalaenopsis equestris TaxID=78828 RepID=UPI0009E396F7|nr:cytochrome c oxidase subunit 6B-like [Phalaenopsis equestris]
MEELKKPIFAYLAEQWSLLKAVPTQRESATESINDENSVTVTPDTVSTEKTDDAPTAKNDNDTAEENSRAPEPKESEEEEAAEEDKPMIKLETAPSDFRFPTTNQTRHCFTRYIEYHRCIAAKGDDSSDCTKFAKYYRALCPGEWIERWNEQRENGTFPGPL